MTPSPDPRRRLLLAAPLLLSPTLHAAPAPAPQGDDATAFARNFDGLRLQDQEGRRFSFASLKGQVLLVHFVFTGCSTVCPVQTRALAEVQKTLPSPARDGIRFLSLSIDPLSDTPAVLKAYAQRMGADLSRWSFVTGAPTDIERVTDRLRLFKPGGKRPDDHTTSLWLVDARGQMVQRLSGNPPDSARVARELVTLHAMKK